MSNVEITALETIRKEIQKLRDKYQTKAEKEREKVNEIFVTIKGEKRNDCKNFIYHEQEFKRRNRND